MERVYKKLDSNVDARSVAFRIAKVLEKGWHTGIRFQQIIYADDTSIYFCFHSQSGQFNKVETAADIKITFYRLTRAKGCFVTLILPNVNRSLLIILATSLRLSSVDANI